MIDIALLGLWGIGNVRTLARSINGARAKNGACSKKENEKPAQLSVIIPVRDEERNIAKLLRSLQNEGADEIIVVDDNSSDATPQIVGSFCGSMPELRLVSARTLPQGWGGKNNACYSGYLEARGDVLMFLDADVCLKEDALGKIREMLRACKLGFLSLSPAQLIVSVGERAVLPGIFLNIIATIDFGEINDTNTQDVALANGQIMVFTRSSYEQIGTHEAVKGEVAEDIAIAKIAKKLKIESRFFYDDGSLANVRMYQSLSECIGGFSKNMSDIIAANNATSVVATSLFAVFSAVNALAVPILLVCDAFEGFAFWLATAGCLLWWSVGAGAILAMRIPLLYTALLPIGYLAFAYLSVKSYLLKINKKRVWKGRSY